MKKTKKKINAAILIIGNEVLSGRTQDANVSFLSNWLNDNCGITVEEVRIIQDIEKKIILNVLDLSKKFNYVFTTGGIGPTHDDITSLSISRAFKARYEFNKEAYQILEKYYGKKNFNDGRKKMAKMPNGSSLIYNPSSAAPGFKIKNIFCLPGVPSILQSMVGNLKIYLKNGLTTINKNFNLETVESYIAFDLEKLQNKFLKTVNIGSYPFFRLGKVGVSIVLSSQSKIQLNACEKKFIKMVKNKKIKLFKNN
jgi:molybdenum cofactor synthesis domain-containing protein